MATAAGSEHAVVSVQCVVHDGQLGQARREPLQLIVSKGTGAIGGSESAKCSGSDAAARSEVAKMTNLLCGKP